MPRRASVAPTEPDDPEALPLLILSATGAVLAQGSPAQLAGQALRLAQLIPKTHPVFLAAAGTVLVFASLAALMEYLSPMVGDRNAGLPAPLRAKSERARTSAAVLDRDVVDRLDPNEWSAHHFIGIHPARRHVALLSAAAQAG